MKVLYHAKPYKVYGVCTDKCDSSSCGDTYTAFLIYLDLSVRRSVGGCVCITERSNLSVRALPARADARVEYYRFSRF